MPGPQIPGFNYIPGVGVVAPLFAFEINSGGLYMPVNRFVILGHGDGTGSLADNTPNVCTSLAQADALVGPNSMLREMVRVALLNAPALPLWIASVPASGTAAVWTDTITSFTGTGIAAIEIEGERIQVNVGSADTPTTIATALAAAVNGYWNQLTGKKLGVTATSSAGVVTYTARKAGAIYNSVDFYVPNLQGNVLAQSGVLTHAVGTAGVGSPSLSSALAALGDSPADFIVAPWADSTNIANYAATTNDTSGRWSWARQSYGHVWSILNASISAQTTLGLSLNDRHLSILGVQNLPTPDWTVCAAWAARAAPWLLDISTGGVSRAQSGLALQGVRAPRAQANWPGYTQRNVMVQSGISIWKVDGAGNVVIDKTVTTQQTGPQGQPDVTFRDIQKVYQAAGATAFIRAALANEQSNKGIADTNPGQLASVATTRDIVGTISHAVVNLNKQGVLDNSAIIVKNLVVARDSINPDRVNVYLPALTVNPLDVIAANATFFSLASQLPN